MHTLTQKVGCKPCPEPKGPCPECEASQRARNHYYTGKLLVARDFRDEQNFFLSKHRLHNRVLHGWGVACGLRVVQHPNADCRDRYVVIQPGTAIDCCGRVIEVPCEEAFDFRAAFLEKWREAQTAAGDPPDHDETPEGEHSFQICVRYRECPTEPIPALFDECGCHDDRTEPNRILESFVVDLLLDPAIPPAEPSLITLEWSTTLNLAGATRVAIDGAMDRLYVLSGQPSATLWAIDRDTHAVLDARSFADQLALDVAVSPDGLQVYVVVQDETGTDDPELLALAAADVGAAPTATTTLAGAHGHFIRLKTAPDGRVVVLDRQSNQLAVFEADLAAAPETAGGLNGPTDLTVAPDGEWIYVANTGGGEVAAFRLDDLTVRESIQPQPGAEPTLVAVASGDDHDVLAIRDGANNELLLVRFDPDDATPVAPIGQPVGWLEPSAFDLALSPTGRWAYLLSRDASEQGVIQVVDVSRVELDQEGAIGAPFSVASFVHSLETSPDGRRLYVPYSSDDPAHGGVIVVDVTEESCCAPLGLRDCPDCSDGGECVVLATVEHFAFGDQVVDPPEDEDDLEDAQAAIDNRLGRRILASTQAIQEAVECLCAERIGARGDQGPPGPAGQDGTDGAPGQPGQDGLGIDEVDVEYIDCDQTPGQPTITVDDDGVRTLHLQIPDCCERDLVHICAINWQHNGSEEQFPRLPAPPGTAGRRGLVIAFDGPVQAADFNSGVAVRVAVLLPEREPLPRLCDCYLDLQPEPAQLNLAPLPGGGCQIVSIQATGVGPVANGVVLRSTAFDQLPDTDDPLMFRVEVMGDFIRDTSGRSTDLEHVAPWVPAAHTGDGKRGGRFESWFAVG
jgi:DNA-binding beta-propeller fold protein YncE